MGASIRYQIVSKTNTYLDGVMAQSAFQETCAKAFGTLPYEFSREDLPAVRLVSRLESNSEAWDRLAELIEKYGRILLVAHY